MLEKMFNIFYFFFPKSFLGKKIYKLCNACETKYVIHARENIFINIFIYLCIIFLLLLK